MMSPGKGVGRGISTMLSTRNPARSSLVAECREIPGNAMLSPGRDITVLFTVDDIMDDELLSRELFEDQSEVDLVVGENVELDLVRSPSKATLAIGDSPQSLEANADRQARSLLELE